MKLDLFNLIIFEKLRDENLIYRYPDLDFSKALIGMASYNGKYNPVNNLINFVGEDSNYHQLISLNIPNNQGFMFQLLAK